MRASIPDQITGTVEIRIDLAEEGGVEPSAVVDLVSTWVRAVDLGFFGPGSIRLQEVKTKGAVVSGRLECEQVSQTALHALARLIRYFSKMKGRIQDFGLIQEGARFHLGDDGVATPALPQSIPFAVEYPDDLHAEVRVEIEFRAPLGPRARDAVFAAFPIWDVLVEALGDEERWGEKADYYTRLLSPAIVEHEVVGYFATFECLHFIVMLGMRLQQQLVIARITFE